MAALPSGSTANCRHTDGARLPFGSPRAERPLPFVRAFNGVQNVGKRPPRRLSEPQPQGARASRSPEGRDGQDLDTPFYRQRPGRRRPQAPRTRRRVGGRASRGLRSRGLPDESGAGSRDARYRGVAATQWPIAVHAHIAATTHRNRDSRGDRASRPTTAGDLTYRRECASCWRDRSLVVIATRTPIRDDEVGDHCSSTKPRSTDGLI